MIKLFSVKVNFDRLYFFFWAKQHPDRCSIIDMHSALLGGIMLFQKMVFFPAGVINGESCEESTTLITPHANKGVLCSILLVGISRYYLHTGSTRRFQRYSFKELQWEFFSLKPGRFTSLVLQGHLVTFGTDENLISFSCKNNTVTECSLIPLIAGRYS